MKMNENKDDAVHSSWDRMLMSRRIETMSRRRYQKGSIKDDKDRWVIRYREDVVDVRAGEVRRVYKQDYLSKKGFPTKRLAQRELDRILETINREDYRPAPAENFAEFADRWKKNILIHDKRSTQRSDKSVIDVHLIPSFGQFSLREITSEVMQAWVSDQSASAKSIRNFVTVMRRMWTTARSWGYAQHDPFHGIKLPTVVKGRVYHFSVEETLAIIEAAQGWKQVFFRILAETGIRPGELAGLRVEDVQGRVIFVKQSVWQREVQTPKTAHAIRKFNVSSGLAEAIQEHIGAVKPTGLIFTAESGRPLSMDNFRNRALNPILEKLGIREKIKAAGVRGGNYAFRHMNATLMDGLNTPLKTRQSRLGHADPSTTLSNYTHAVDADDLAFSDQAGALLTPKKNEAIQ